MIRLLAEIQRKNQGLMGIMEEIEQDENSPSPSPTCTSEITKKGTSI